MIEIARSSVCSFTMLLKRLFPSPSLRVYALYRLMTLPENDWKKRNIYNNFIQITFIDPFFQIFQLAKHIAYSQCIEHTVIRVVPE